MRWLFDKNHVKLNLRTAHYTVNKNNRAHSNLPQRHWSLEHIFRIEY